MNLLSLKTKCSPLLEKILQVVSYKPLLYFI